MVMRTIFALSLVCGLLTLQVNAQQSEAARKLFKETKNKADKGDAQSQLAVASFYASGTGVDPDPAKAVKYYRKASDQGLAQAQFQLGLSYAQGEGVKENAVEAAYWFTQAAEQGLVEAEIQVGRCFLTGKGVNPNGVEAVKWFRKAAGRGSSAAEFYLGKCYFEGTGVSRDIEEGLKWTEHAAQAGFAPAQNALGGCYEKGTGLGKDYLQAYKWFALAAAQDDANAANIRVSMARVETFLTKEQVAEAQRLAREFKPVAPSSTPVSAGQAQPGASDSGFVTVTAEDGQSEVFADGGFVGNTPAKLKLKEGLHVIEVKRPGFKDYRREIRISAGSDLNIRASLERN